MSHWIVDRVEGELAILEGPEGFVERPLRELPEGLKEGEALDAELRRVTALSEAEARLARLRAQSPPDDGDMEL